MPREYDYILRVASRFMGMNTLKEDKEQILELDWDVVVYQAILHKMVPILFDDLKKTKLVQCINNSNFAYRFYLCTLKIQYLAGIRLSKFYPLPYAA